MVICCYKALTGSLADYDTASDCFTLSLARLEIDVEMCNLRLGLFENLAEFLNRSLRLCRCMVTATA